MSSVTVTNQADLDAALAAKAEHVVIDSPAGVWLTIRDSGSSRVVARDSSRVVARGSSSVVAWDSSSVEAWYSSSVEARGSIRVEAWDSSSVVARGSSSVVARDSSRVVAWDSSSVVAWDSSSVEARDSSSVEAWDSSSVVARGSSSVEAGRFVAVHLWSQHVTLTGNGHVIDMTTLDLTDTDQWLDYHGVKRDCDRAIVYKAVDADLNAGHGYTLTRYVPGETVTAPDWRADTSCGHGLHFSPSPSGARRYYNGDGPPRFLACTVAADTLVALDDKCKAPSCVVLHEVDIHGDRLGES